MARSTLDHLSVCGEWIEVCTCCASHDEYDSFCGFDGMLVGICCMLCSESHCTMPESCSDGVNHVGDCGYADGVGNIYSWL